MKRELLAIAGFLLSSPALAWERPTFGWRLGVTSDSIAIGYSLNARKPAPFGEVSLFTETWYAGLYYSDVQFGQNSNGSSLANTQLASYAGWTPKLGDVSFDLSTSYFSYPGARDGGPKLGEFAELDFIEFRGSAAIEPIKGLTTTAVAFYYPNYGFGQGEIWRFEGIVAYKLRDIWRIKPTIGGTIGTVMGKPDDVEHPFELANGASHYEYWNVGLQLDIDKLRIEIQYWNTNISNRDNWCTSDVFQCDGAFNITTSVNF